MSIPVCVMPEPPVFIGFDDPVIDLRAIIMMGIMDVIHEKGADCAANTNDVPFPDDGWVA